MNGNAKWIWLSHQAKPDEYGEFYTEFTHFGGYTNLKISVDGDYVLYVNGQFVECNQYADYEHYKIYDELDITAFLKRGVNSIAVLVWHFGLNCSRFKAAPAGLWFTVEENGTPVCKSDACVKARLSRAYASHREKKATSQIGYSFLYDAKNEDEWIHGRLVGFENAVEVQKFCDLYPRPIKKQVLFPRVDAKLVKREGNRQLFDLGREIVGLLSFSIESETEQEITFSYGEHIEDGWVRGLIVNSYKQTYDFRLPYLAKAGRGEYTNYLYRLAARYIEIDSPSPVCVSFVGLVPQGYPVGRKPFTLENALDKTIYDTCVKTLELCMMEHYVDGPWREQAFYVFDSKNQMLSGYYAFEGGNFDYARANLLLYSKDRRADGLLSICCPSGNKGAIPSFAVHYVSSVLEYVKQSGDVSLGRETYGKCKEILSAFLNNRKDGLVCEFETLWNFYEWSYLSSGGLFTAVGEKANQPDGYINALTAIALDDFSTLCKLIGYDDPYAGISEEIKQKSYAAFYRKDEGMYALTEKRDVFSVFGNALAVYSGIVKGAEAERICDLIASGGGGIACTLSANFFKYEALLKSNAEKYKDFVFDEIRKDYGMMLEKGATSFWETLEGADAFEKAGSLCHGWSAIPAYFYAKYAK